MRPFSINVTFNVVLWLFPAVLFGADEGRLSIRIVDEQGELTPARCWVDVEGKRLFEPMSPETATPYVRDRSFSCDGEFTLLVPAGDATVHVEKGKEFLPVNVDVQVMADQVTEQAIELKRWIDMPENGWYSADLHVHFGSEDPRVLRQLALADDVHLIPSFTYWLRGRGERWQAQWPDGTFNDPMVIDRSHVVTRNNIEIERIDRRAEPGGTVGATFLFNLQRPVTAVRYGEHFPTDAELCRVARKYSPAAVFDSDKPSWAETVIGVALGQLDTIQVCHNHYHRNTSIPGGYGMIGPLTAGESNAAAGDGLFHRTNALYYRFLNCGFRLGVSGGSAIGVMPLPAGHHRVYANVEGPLTPNKLWAAIRAGESFATTGPILTLAANGSRIGSVLSLHRSDLPSIQVQTMVRAIEPLESLEIIHDGRVLVSRSLTGESPDPFLESSVETTIHPKRSGWIAARALYRASDGLLRQAHTSPIYLTLDDEPTAYAEDARYMIRWVDQLRDIARSQPDRFPDQSAQSAVLAQYSQARSIYQAVIDKATRFWGN